MKLELTLMELNDLYYVVSKGVEKHKEYVEIAKRSTPELEKYFDRELDKSVQLLDKIQTALYDEANRMDDVINEVKTDRDYSAFKQYADSMNEAQSEDRVLGNI
jgi:ribosome-binding factor A